MGSRENPGKFDCYNQAGEAYVFSLQSLLETSSSH